MDAGPRKQNNSTVIHLSGAVTMTKFVLSFILFALFIVFPGRSYSSIEPDQKIKFSVRVTGSVSEVSRFQKIAALAEKVVNSPEFESRVKNARTVYGKSFSYSDLSGPQVYEKMLQASELKSEPNGIWDMEFVFESKVPKCFGIGRFKKCSAYVLGWTQPNWREIYINSYGWNDRSDIAIAGTIVHEYLHKLGFSHPFNNTRTRHLSVPYAVGNLVSELAPKFL